MSKRDNRWLRKDDTARKENMTNTFKFERAEHDDFSWNVKMERTDRYQRKQRNRERDRRREDYWD